MNQVFVRSEQLADKIHDIKLYIPEWKMLFSLDGRKNEDDIAGFLETDLQEVQNTLSKLQEMGLIVPESGEMPVAEETEPADRATEFIDDTLNSFEKVDEGEGAVEEPVAESEPEQEPVAEQEMVEQPLEIEAEQAEEPVKAEDITPELQEEFAQESEELKPEGFDELVLEETPEEKEQESEQDLDSLINDLLKEESVSEQDGEAPKILDEEEMAQWAEEDITPEQPSPDLEEAAEGEESTEEAAEKFEVPEAEIEEKPEEDIVKEDTFGTSEQEDVVPATEEIPEVEIPEDEMVSSEGEQPDQVVAEEPAEKVPEEAVDASLQDQKTILVVDDSIVIRKMVEIALENERYNVVSVATGKEAFSYLDSKDPDLVILDIMLPDVNGLDILKAIKAKTTIPVVMLSAKDTPKETGQAKELGADDFIPKPFRDEELVGKIHELIGQ